MAKRSEPKKLMPGENGHHLETGDGGYNNGYDVKDGKYILSSGRSELMMQTRIERAALHEYIRSMNLFITERFKEITASEQRWWTGILPALQIAPEDRDGWQLTFNDRRAVIFKASPETPKE